MDNVQGQQPIRDRFTNDVNRQGLFGSRQVDLSKAPMAFAKEQGKGPSIIGKFFNKVTGKALFDYAAYDPRPVVEAFKTVYEKGTREEQRAALKHAMGLLAAEYPNAQAVGYGEGLLKEVSDMMGLHGMAQDPMRVHDPEQLVTNMHYFYNLAIEVANEHFNTDNETELSLPQQIGHGMIEGMINNTLNNLIEHNASVVAKYIPQGTDPREALVLLLGTTDTTDNTGTTHTIANYPPRALQEYYTIAYPKATNEERNQQWQQDVTNQTGPYRDPKTFSPLEIQWLKKSVPIDRMKDFVQMKGGDRAEIIDWTRPRRKTRRQPNQVRVAPPAKRQQLERDHIPVHQQLQRQEREADPKPASHVYQAPQYHDDDEDLLYFDPFTEDEETDDDDDFSIQQPNKKEGKDKDIEHIVFPDLDVDGLDNDGDEPPLWEFKPYTLPSKQKPPSYSEEEGPQLESIHISQIQHPVMGQGNLVDPQGGLDPLHSQYVHLSSRFDPDNGRRAAYEQYIPLVPKHDIRNLYESVKVDDDDIDLDAIAADLDKINGPLSLDHMERNPEIYGNVMELFSPQDFFNRIPADRQMSMLSPIVDIDSIDDASNIKPVAVEDEIPVIEADKVNTGINLSTDKKNSFLGALGADGDDPQGIQRLLEVTIRDHYDNAHDDKNLANGFQDQFGINLMRLAGKVNQGRLNTIGEDQLAVMLAIAKDQPVVVVDEITGNAVAYVPAEKDEKHPYQLPQKIEGTANDVLGQVANPITLIHNTEDGTWRGGA
ncbi:MAG TPA: hypothetical protein DIU37_04150 [Opitutae bacterium]|nr:hypothetical protein [Opitutae bacterium]